MKFPATAQVTKPHLPATNLITLDRRSSRMLLPLQNYFKAHVVSVSKCSPKHRQGDLARQRNGSTGVQIIFRAVCHRYIHRFRSSSWYQSLHQVTTLSSLWSTALHLSGTLYPNVPNSKELQVYKTTARSNKMENIQALCNLTRRLVWGFWMRLACMD